MMGYSPVIGRGSWLISISVLEKLKLTSEHVVTGVLRTSSASDKCRWPGVPDTGLNVSKLR